MCELDSHLRIREEVACSVTPATPATEPFSADSGAVVGGEEETGWNHGLFLSEDLSAGEMGESRFVSSGKVEWGPQRIVLDSATDGARAEQMMMLSPLTPSNKSALCTAFVEAFLPAGAGGAAED